MFSFTIFKYDKNFHNFEFKVEYNDDKIKKIITKIYNLS